MIATADVKGTLPVFSSGSSKGKFFSLPFQLLEAAGIPRLIAPFHLQRQQWPVESFIESITLTLTLLPVSSTFGGPFDYIGATQISPYLKAKLGCLTT